MRRKGIWGGATRPEGWNVGGGEEDVQKGGGGGGEWRLSDSGYGPRGQDRLRVDGG